MKRILLSLAACLSLAASASAGHQTASGKDYKNPAPPCFQDQELQLDIFGLYGWTAQGDHDDGFGGGLGVNYFFLRNLGIGVDGSVRDADPALWTSSVSLIVRFPIESGDLCLAPYFLAGGGVQTNGTTRAEYHAGGGLEFRCPQGFGVFTEGRYFWAGNNDDQIQARLGFRVVF